MINSKASVLSTFLLNYDLDRKICSHAKRGQTSRKQAGDINDLRFEIKCFHQNFNSTID